MTPNASVEELKRRYVTHSEYSLTEFERDVEQALNRDVPSFTGCVLEK